MIFKYVAALEEIRNDGEGSNLATWCNWASTDYYLAQMRHDVVSAEILRL
jgi:hypothetical protein